MSLQTITAGVGAPVITSCDLPQVRVKYSHKSEFLPEIKRSEDAARILHGLFNADTISFSEEFLMLLLNRANHVLGWARVSAGGLNGCLIDTRVIFAVALSTAASSIIVAHNHPSGRLRPSQSDRTTTNKLVEAGSILDIPCIDHLIIAPNGGFFSFADEGLM